MAVRPYREEDRDAVLTLVVDARAIDSPSARVHIDDDRRVKAAALWVRPDAGDEPYLASVIAPSDGGTLPDPEGPVARWQQAYALAAACIEDAIALNYRRGHLVVQSDALRRHIERDLGLRFEATGREPRTGTPVEWRLDVDLDQALEQLRRYV